MRLAIGGSTAFGPALARGGRAFYERPQAAAPMLRWWRDKGVEGVVLYDVMPGFYSVTAEQWRALRGVIEEAGLEMAAFNGLRKSLHLPELAEVDRRKLDTIMAACAILRPAIVDLSVNVPLPGQRDPHYVNSRALYRGEYAGEEAWQAGADGLKRLARECADLGAQLSIELHDDGLHDTAANCLRLLHLVDEPNVGVNPDIGNAYRVPYEIRESPRQMMTLLAPHTNYWEVKNYKKIYSVAEQRYYAWNTELNAGDMNFREAAEILWRAGFRGWVSNEGGTGDHVYSTLQYLAYMRWTLDEWLPFASDAFPE